MKDDISQNVRTGLNREVKLKDLLFKEDEKLGEASKWRLTLFRLENSYKNLFLGGVMKISESIT